MMTKLFSFFRSMFFGRTEAQRCLDEQTIKALKALLVRKAQERHARGEISDEKLADYITRYTEEATQ